MSQETDYVLVGLKSESEAIGTDITPTSAYKDSASAEYKMEDIHNFLGERERFDPL